MFWFIVMLSIVGAVAGVLARWLVPGRNPLSLARTAALGVDGSFLGGIFGWLLFGHDLEEGALQPSAIIGSVLGAVLLLLVLNQIRGRGGFHLRRRR